MHGLFGVATGGDGCANPLGDQNNVWYFIAPGRFFLPNGSPATSWGERTVHVEVGDDQLAVRQIDRFKNGNVLCYDRDHRRDEFGYLVGMRFSRKPKWRKFYPNAEIIAAAEFDAEWKKSLNSANHVNRRRPTVRPQSCGQSSR